MKRFVEVIQDWNKLSTQNYGKKESSNCLSKWIKIENYFEKLSVSKFICRYNVLSLKKLPSKFHGIIMGRSPNYGRNSNILIPDPYH